jgi:hypothetical protein
VDVGGFPAVPDDDVDGHGPDRAIDFILRELDDAVAADTVYATFDEELDGGVKCAVTIAGIDVKKDFVLWLRKVIALDE